MSYNTNIDIINRAKKLYNKKGFEFFFRESITNAIHSCIMRNVSEKLKVDIRIKKISENSYKIVIHDEGIGFDDISYTHFTTLDKENDNKIKSKLPSFG